MAYIPIQDKRICDAAYSRFFVLYHVNPDSRLNLEITIFYKKLHFY